MSAATLLLALRLLMALTLYAFFAAVLIYLWRDLRSASLFSQQIPLAHLHLQEQDSEVRQFRLTEVNLVGRTPENSITIADDTISSHHARLSFYKGQWWVEDLGSRNGTRVNDIPVEVPLVVTHGDRIELGRVSLKFVTGPFADPPKQTTIEE